MPNPSNKIGVYVSRTLRVFGSPLHIDFDFCCDENGDNAVNITTTFVTDEGKELSYSDFLNLEEATDFRIKFYGEDYK